MPSWIFDHANWKRLVKAARISAGKTWNQMTFSKRARRSALVFALAAAGTAPLLPVVAGSPAADRAKQEQAAESAAALRALLTQPDVDARREAVLQIESLGSLGGKAADLLVEPLHDSDAEVRACTAMALLRLGQHRDASVMVLAALLESDAPEERCLAAFILGEFRVTDSVATERLETCLKDGTAEVRLHTAEALVKIDSEHAGALTELTNGLASTDEAERAFAIHALGVLDQTPNPTLAFRMAAAQGDSDLDVAAGSALTLIRWNASAAKASERAFVSKERVENIKRLLDNGSPAARQAAAVRLGVAVDPDSKVAGAARAHLHDQDAIVRSNAALALCASSADAQAVEDSLVELLDSTSDQQAIVGLGAVGRMPSASRPLVEGAQRHLRSANGTVRILAAAVVARVAPDHPQVLAVLAQGISSGSPESRTLAARTLRITQWQNDARVRQSLASAAREDNLRIRAAANQVMSGGGRPAAVRPAGFVEELSGSSDDEDGGAGDVGQTTTAPVEGEPTLVTNPGSVPLVVPSQEIPLLDSVVEPNTAPPPSRPVSRGAASPIRTVHRSTDDGPEFKSIERVSAAIVPPAGELPLNPGEDKARQLGGRFHQLGVSRGFAETACMWTPAAVKHYPLYFQEINLERYGYHYGCFQSVVSGATFAKNVALFPVHVVGAPPCWTEYAVGYERPGNCAEVNCYRHRLFTSHECDDGDEEPVPMGSKISR